MPREGNEEPNGVAAIVRHGAPWLGAATGLAFGAAWILASVTLGPARLTPEQIGVDFVWLATRALVAVLVLGSVVALPVWLILLFLDWKGSTYVASRTRWNFLLGFVCLVILASWAVLAFWAFGEEFPPAVLIEVTATAAASLAVAVTALHRDWVLRSRVLQKRRFVVLPLATVLVVLGIGAINLPRRAAQSMESGRGTLLPLGLLRIEPVDVTPLVDGLDPGCYLLLGERDGSLAIVKPGAAHTTYLVPNSGVLLSYRGEACDMSAQGP